MNVHEARVRAQQARDEIDRALGSLRHGTEDIPQAVADLMLARLGVGVALRHLGRPVPSREVIEYRAVGVIDGASMWTPSRTVAEGELARMRVYQGSLRLDDTYLERRTVTYGEPERVKEGDDHA